MNFFLMSYTAGNSMSRTHIFPQYNIESILWFHWAAPKIAHLRHLYPKGPWWLSFSFRNSHMMQNNLKMLIAPNRSLIDLVENTAWRLKVQIFE